MRPKKHETTGSGGLFRARAPGGRFALHARTLPGNPYDMTAARWAPSSKPLRGSPAARSSVPMSTRETAATMPQTRAASSSQAKNAGFSAESNVSSRSAPPSRR